MTAYVNLVCHWGVNLTCQYLFTFKLGWGVEGMWVAKTVMEVCILAGYTIVIEMHDWRQSIFESRQRNKIKDVL